MKKRKLKSEEDKVKKDEIWNRLNELNSEFKKLDNRKNKRRNFCNCK